MAVLDRTRLTVRLLLFRPAPGQYRLPFFALSEPVRREDEDDAGKTWYQTERACREPEKGNTRCFEKLLGHARGPHEARALAGSEEDPPTGLRF